jgi:hypothetical protein
LDTYGGPTAISDWRRLAARLRPLTDGVKALPAVAVRPDAGALLTLVFKYPLAVLRTLRDASRGLTRPFSEIVAEVAVTDRFLKNYLNMLAFLLQVRAGARSAAAAMAAAAAVRAGKARTARGPARQRRPSVDDPYSGALCSVPSLCVFILLLSSLLS